MSLRLTLALLLGLCLVHPASALPPASDPLPVDPGVRIGRLDNGLTYYVRENHKPEHRAELRVAVNAGSLLERDDQQGTPISSSTWRSTARSISRRTT